VVADRRNDAGGKSALAHHPPSVGLNHRLLGECGAQVSAAAAEEEALLVLTDAGRGNVGVYRLRPAVMAGHDMLLPAILMQAD